jgi:hypothetical protein
VRVAVGQDDPTFMTMTKGRGLTGRTVLRGGVLVMPKSQDISLWWLVYRAFPGGGNRLWQIFEGAGVGVADAVVA